MLIASYATVKPEMASTRTYQDWYKFLGQRPARLGIMSRLYPHLTASFLTESLMNVFYNEKKPSKFQKINSLMFEWEIDVEQIRRIPFLTAPVSLGGQMYEFEFPERYYERLETFIIDGSRQQIIILEAPLKISDGRFRYVGQLIGNDYRAQLDMRYCTPGAETRFLTNYNREFHSEGYSKFQSNLESHRNYISLHRNDASFSQQYALQEDVFIKIAQGEDAGSLKETMFKMTPVHRQAMDSFMFARNNALLFGKCNFDENGKCLVVDPEVNIPIPIGDGIISQVERYAGFMEFTNLTTGVFDTMIADMTQKSENAQGNDYMFLINERLNYMVNTTLRKYLRDWSVATAAVYSKAANGKIEVGEDFQAYSIAGNKIIFKVDRTLSREYNDRAYGILLDLTADKISGNAAINMFTLKGAEFLTNQIKGVGGMTGTESGDVVSPVAGSKYIVHGYAGVGVFSPYRSYIISEYVPVPGA